MKHISRKNTNNKGFSILELIVVIAIMATLTGMLVPRVMKYVTDNKRNACVQNREAILSVYEKCVYDMVLDASQSSLDTVLAASDSSVLPQEYMNQVKDFLICPSDGASGHYHVNFFQDTDNAKAYITCDQHQDEVCMVDLTGWVKINEEEGVDAVITAPAGGGSDLPFEPSMGGGSEDDEEEAPVIDEETFATLGVWPYSLDAEGRTDARWQTAGIGAGKYVSIPVPTYAHFMDNGQEYLIIRPTDASGSGYKVLYENSDTPAINANRDGVLYNVTTSKKTDVYLNENGSFDELHNDNAPVYKNVKVDEAEDTWRVEVSADLGDMITVHYANGAVSTFFYTGESFESLELPGASDKSYGIGYGDWYLVPAIK